MFSSSKNYVYLEPFTIWQNKLIAVLLISALEETYVHNMRPVEV